MKVEIWSDIVCPFCYIGKRRFEEALAGFEFRDDVQIQWKSFQLNPDLKTDTAISHIQYLAEAKGWTPDYARQTNRQLTEMAAQVGLNCNMENVVIANSFDAHQFAHAAADAGKGDAAEELLFEACFTLGRNIADHEVLAGLGGEIGLDAAELRQQLAANEYAGEIQRDIYEAQVLNIRSVPFFVIDDKYAIQGAQPAALFLETLQKAYTEKNSAD